MSHRRILGESIQWIRKQKKMTQEDLAKAVGVNRATISKYETGEIDMSIDTCVAIGEVLGWHFMCRFTNDEIENPQFCKELV